jgi:Homeo-prospero domain
MEKYARQALAEGVKNVNDLVVTKDDELYRVLILHYNRNNQIEVRTFIPVLWLQTSVRHNCVDFVFVM